MPQCQKIVFITKYKNISDSLNHDFLFDTVTTAYSKCYHIKSFLNKLCSLIMIAQPS